MQEYTTKWPRRCCRRNSQNVKIFKNVIEPLCKIFEVLFEAGTEKEKRRKNQHSVEKKFSFHKQQRDAMAATA